MEERIVKFINALRTAGVRVSLAESADAFRAIEIMGAKNQDEFYSSLQSSLIKGVNNQSTFNELFPIFFGGGEAPQLLNLSDDLSADEGRILAQALHQFNEKLRNILEKLVNGHMLNESELSRLAKMTGLTQMDDLRYREWMTERLKKALRFPEVHKAIQELAEMLVAMGMDILQVQNLSQMMHANQEALEKQLGQFAAQRISENQSRKPPNKDVGDLLNKPFMSLSERDMQTLRVEVQRLAKILKTRVALRQKRAKSGQLDAKATIRANLKHGNIPIQIKYRDRKLKPKLVVICDISTSMRFCSELMLSLLFEMQDQISQTHAFAFIDHLEFISPEFVGRSPKRAVNRVLNRLPTGYYNTDLGNSLENLQREYLDRIDSRTTFIVVGDGRNNYNNPRLDIFLQLARRSKRTIWINPEAPSFWGTGDSDMMLYAPNCDKILQASTLAQLTEALNTLLVH